MPLFILVISWTLFIFGCGYQVGRKVVLVAVQDFINKLPMAERLKIVQQMDDYLANFKQK